jgi:hypothetical protein
LILSRYYTSAQARTLISDRNQLTEAGWDREFESGFLQRGVSNEPSRNEEYARPGLESISILGSRSARDASCADTGSPVADDVKMRKSITGLPAIPSFFRKVPQNVTRCAAIAGDRQCG